MRIFTYILLALLGLLYGVNSLNDFSQLVVSEIIRRNTDASLIEELENGYLNKQSRFFPESLMSFPGIGLLSQYINRDTGMLSEMSFYGNPFVMSGDYQNQCVNEVNSLSTLQMVVPTFLYNKDAVLPRSKSVFWSSELHFSQFLSTMIDIHTPLHNINVFSVDAPPPMGNTGGRGTMVHWMNGEREMSSSLFAFGESLGGAYDSEPVDLSDEDLMVRVKQEADTLMAVYPRDSYDKDFICPSFEDQGSQAMQFQSIVSESFELAKTIVKSIPEAGVLSPALVDRVRAQQKSKATIASYRAACILQHAKVRAEATTEEDDNSRDELIITDYWKTALYVVAVMLSISVVFALVMGAVTQYQETLTHRKMQAQQMEEAHNNSSLHQFL